jgi:Ca2+-dependent lipid-binding protein
MWRRGVLFGRKAVTDVQYNTLFPQFAEAKQPIYYHGTRSDLENENLRIEVWDWDQVSRNDLIGFAEVPLRGVFLSGRVSTSLALEDASASKQPKSASTAEGGDGSGPRMIHAGTIEGAIELMAEPAHTQFGDVVKRQPKMTYLAVKIIRATDLPGKKPDGTSDPYVTAVWAATSQQTRGECRTLETPHAHSIAPSHPVHAGVRASTMPL